MDEQNIVISEELKSFSKSFAFAYSLKSPKNKHLLDELLSLTSFLDSVYNNITIGQRAWHIKNNNFSLRICPICGKPMHYDNRYKLHYDCGQKKAKNTLNSKSKEEWKSIIEKQKETNIFRYGFENPAKNEEIKSKINETNIKKCGFKRQSSLESVKNKIYESQEKLHGGMGNRSLITRDKVKLTCNEKNGGIGFASDKQYENFVKKRLEDSIFYNYVEKQETLQYVNNCGDGNHLILCKKCNEEFYFNSDRRYRINNEIDLCPNCNQSNSGTSILEKQLLSYVRSIYKLPISENDRSILKNKNIKNKIVSYEIDIFLKDIFLAIEFNGTKIHGDKRFFKESDILMHGIKASYAWNKDSLKKRLCIKNGIKLVTIWEYDWNKRNDVVKRYVKMIIDKLMKEHGNR